MLAVARPIPRSQDQVGDLAQTGASVARADRVQCVDAASKLQMWAVWRNRRCEGTDRGKPRLQITVVREVEMQRDRPSHDSAVDNVQSDSHAVPIDQ